MSRNFFSILQLLQFLINQRATQHTTYLIIVTLNVVKHPRNKVVPVISNIRAAVPHWPLFLFLFYEINVKNTACVTEKPLDMLI